MIVCTVCCIPLIIDMREQGTLSAAVGGNLVAPRWRQVCLLFPAHRKQAFVVIWGVVWVEIVYWSKDWIIWWQCQSSKFKCQVSSLKYSPLTSRGQYSPTFSLLTFFFLAEEKDFCSTNTWKNKSRDVVSWFLPSFLLCDSQLRSALICSLGNLKITPPSPPPPKKRMTPYHWATASDQDSAVPLKDNKHPFVDNDSRQRGQTKKISLSTCRKPLFTERWGAAFILFWYLFPADSVLLQSIFPSSMEFQNNVT